MKTLGLIGGMSWESTVPYYRIVNQTVKERLGGLHSARLLLYSVDFHEIEQLQRGGEWERAGTLLADGARRLQSAGADFLTIARRIALDDAQRAVLSRRSGRDGGGGQGKSRQAQGKVTRERHVVLLFV